MRRKEGRMQGYRIKRCVSGKERWMEGVSEGQERKDARGDGGEKSRCEEKDGRRGSGRKVYAKEGWKDA